MSRAKSSEEKEGERERRNEGAQVRLARAFVLSSSSGLLCALDSEERPAPVLATRRYQHRTLGRRTFDREECTREHIVDASRRGLICRRWMTCLLPPNGSTQQEGPAERWEVSFGKRPSPLAGAFPTSTPVPRRDTHASADAASMRTSSCSSARPARVVRAARSH